MKKMRFLFSAVLVALATLFLVSCELGYASSHTLTYVEEVPATCTSRGIGAHYVSEDGLLFRDKDGKVKVSLGDLYIEPLAHELVLVEGYPSTCSAVGRKDYYACEHCGKMFADEAGLVGVTLEGLVIAKLKHTPLPAVVENNVDPDCTNEGSYDLVVYCDVCGEELSREHVIVDELGHTPLPAVVENNVDPDCTNKGSYDSVVYCDVCGEELSREHVIVDELGHTQLPAVVENNVDPDCTNKGSYDSVVYCDVCGEELSRTHVEVNALGHSLVKHDAVAPHEDVPGNIEYYECTRCGELFSDELGLNPITLDDTIVYATSYTYQLKGGEVPTPGYYVDYRSGRSFVDASNTGVFVTNNKGLNSTSAYFDIYFTAKGTFTLTYNVSSEAKWDKFTMYSWIGEVQTTVVNAVSGEVSDTLEFSVNNGDHLTFVYSKDSSGFSGTDTVTLTNMNFTTYVEFKLATVEFATDGGDEIEAISVYQNMALELADATKEGYFFEGWFTDEELETAFDATQGVSDDTVLYAKFVKGLVISFTNVEGNVVPSQLVKPGELVTVPTVEMVAEGKYFAGWYADAELSEEFDFTAAPTTDTTIYAAWRMPIVLSFNSNGGTLVQDIETDVNTAITAPTDPTKEGYRFAGWFVDLQLETAFDFASGIESSMVVFAKWVAVVQVTYYYNGNAMATETIDAGTAFTPTKPEAITVPVDGWYLDAEFAEMFEDGTVVNANISLHAKEHQYAPAGVLESVQNITNKASKIYEFAYDQESDTLTSTNKGVSSSKSQMIFTFAKQSLVSFDYLISSESNYDYLAVTLNGDSVLSTKVSGMNGVEITGQFSQLVAAGDVLTITYSKDSSGNHGSDSVIISNLVITDGVAQVTITLYLADEQQASFTVDQLSNVSESEGLADNTPSDTESRRFLRWYMDSEFTLPLTDTTLATTNLDLYAKYSYPLHIVFDVEEGATEVAPLDAWTGVSLVDVMPEDPTKEAHIFRGWLNKFGDLFDPAEGIEETSCTLTAFFEGLPAGSTKDMAVEAVLVNGYFEASGYETTEEFQQFYMKFTPTATDAYYIGFNNINKVGGNSNSTYYARVMVMDSNEVVVLSPTSESLSRVHLVANETYYVVFDLAASSTSYQVWGTFDTSIEVAEQDRVEEALEIELNETQAIPVNTFTNTEQQLMYRFEATTTDSYLLSITSNAWAVVYVYDNANLTTPIVTRNVYSTTRVANMDVVEGQTYYLVVDQNWNMSELATKEIVFSISEYEQGYKISDPLEYTLGDMIYTNFYNGVKEYHHLVLSESGTYLFTLGTNSTSYTKVVNIYATTNLNEPVQTISASSSMSQYLEGVPAGEYVIELYNNSSTDETSFGVSFREAVTGEYWSTAETLTLADSMSVQASLNGYYYTFTTGAEQLWHFFEIENATIEVYSADRKLIGETALHFDANTTYYLVVIGTNEATIQHTTLSEYRDGKSAASAFVYSEENRSLPTDATGSYSIYYEFTVSESGRYRIYSHNNSSVDTKGYLGDSAELTTSNRLSYNDDAGSSNDYVGYKYDFYMEYDLVADQTYYILTTYSIYSSSKGAEMYVVVELAA